MRTHNKEFQNNLTPEKAYEVLKEGNKRFHNNLKLNRDLRQQLLETAEGQYPFAVAVSCMDSRTSVELIFDQGFGEIFSIRVAGNIINDDILGSLEYACHVVGCKVILVLGHTRCGAVEGACKNVKLNKLTGLLEKIQPAISNTKHTIGDADYFNHVAHENVLHSLEEILNRSSVIEALYKERKIGLIGGMYSVETGKIEFIKEMFDTKVLKENKEAVSV